MRKVHLNTAAAKDALSILTKGELLEHLSEPTEGIFEFKTTEKGKAALAQYYQLITYFFETKLKGRPLQYIILPLLLHLPRLIFDRSSSNMSPVHGWFGNNK
jgi:DNA primase